MTTSQKVKDRVVNAADYMIKTHCTIREAAKEFGVAKSSLYHQIVNYLPYIDKARYNQVEKVLKENKADAHIRGGISTGRLIKLGKIPMACLVKRKVKQS